MNTLFQFLLSSAGPLALRIIAALGVSILTFTGVDTSLNALISHAQSAWGGVSADIMGLASLAGVPADIGIICGAMVARSTMWVAAAATKWITAK